MQLAVRMIIGEAMVEMFDNLLDFVDVSVFPLLLIVL